MATHWAGSEGTVKVGANAVAEITAFSIEETADTVEDTSMGDTSRTFKVTLKSWNGSLECHWDETDTNGQVALTVGSEVTLNVYPEGATTGDTYLTGTAIVTGVSVAGELNGLVSRSLTFQGNGALTIGTVS